MNKDLAHRRVADSLVARSPPLIPCYLYAPALFLLYRPVDAIATSTVNFIGALCEAELSTIDRERPTPRPTAASTRAALIPTKINPFEDLTTLGKALCDAAQPVE
jgi:hypothetical protein